MRSVFISFLNFFIAFQHLHTLLQRVGHAVFVSVSFPFTLKVRTPHQRSGLPFTLKVGTPHQRSGLPFTLKMATGNVTVKVTLVDENGEAVIDADGN